MTNTTYPIRTPILRVVQPLGEFFVAVLPAELLLQVTYSDPLRILGVSNQGEYELKGHQRKLVRERLMEIGRYIDTVEAAFPNSIILAANYRENGDLEEDESLRWAIEFSPGQSQAGTLVIPSAAKLAAIIDGQHRLYGFNEITLKERAEMPLLCAVYIDLPNPFQAYLFATINYNQRPVNKSQTYELYGYNLEEEPPDAWSPEKTAVFLCRKLNTDRASVFRNHIIVAAQSDIAVELAAESIKQEWAVSTATIVGGLLRLFSTNPKRDRDFMHRKEMGKGRSRQLLATGEQLDRTPLRDYYLKGNDLLILTITQNYFNAAADVLWGDAHAAADKLIVDARRSYIRKTVGIQALFDVLRSLCTEAIAAKDVSQKYFAGRLSRCRSIDFSDNFFQASGTGRQRIRNALEFSIGLKSADSLPPCDLSDYARLCSTN